MKNIKLPVYLTTAVLVIYTALCQIYPGSLLTIIIFMCSPLLVIWMVYRVLKDGVPSSRTFDEYFYDDADIRPVQSTEATGNARSGEESN